MPQELHVLRCYSCNTFQVHIVKKSSNKWQCKMCGEKQSVKQVYGRGSGKDCRLHVQKLNDLRRQKSEYTHLIVNNNIDDYNQFKEQETTPSCYVQSDKGMGKQSLQLCSKWSKFVSNDSDYSSPEQPSTVQPSLETPLPKINDSQLGKHESFTRDDIHKILNHEDTDTGTDDCSELKRYKRECPLNGHLCEITKWGKFINFENEDVSCQNIFKNATVSQEETVNNLQNHAKNYFRVYTEQIKGGRELTTGTEYNELAVGKGATKSVYITPTPCKENVLVSSAPRLNICAKKSPQIKSKWSEFLNANDGINISESATIQCKSENTKDELSSSTLHTKGNHINSVSQECSVQQCGGKQFSAISNQKPTAVLRTHFMEYTDDEFDDMLQL